MTAQRSGRAPLPLCSGWLGGVSAAPPRRRLFWRLARGGNGASVEGKGFDAFFLVGRAGLTLARRRSVFSGWAAAAGSRATGQGARGDTGKPTGSTSCRGDMGATRRLWLIAAGALRQGAAAFGTGRDGSEFLLDRCCFSTFPSKRNLSAGQRKAAAAKTLLQRRSGLPA